MEISQKVLNLIKTTTPEQVARDVLKATGLEHEYFPEREAIYKFYANFGCMGELYGLFVSTPRKLVRNIGMDAYFGEVLGKHSDVSLVLKLEHFTFITDEPDFVTKFIVYDLETGYNPLNYIDAEVFEDD